MDDGVIDKASKTVIYTCCDCYFTENDEEKFKTHVCYKTDIDKLKYIEVCNRNSVLEKQNTHYLNVINNQIIKINTLESILAQFTHNQNNTIYNCTQKVTDSVPTEPKVTEPKVTDSVSTEPKVTDSVSTEPKVTDPMVTEPKVTDSVPTAPKVTDSVPTAPKVTDSVPTAPKVTEPKVTEPKVTEPKVTEPKAMDSVPTEPKVTDSVSTAPKVTDSVPTEPKATEPKVTEPKATEPKVTEPKVTEQTDGKKMVFRTVRGVNIREPYTQKQIKEIEQKVHEKENEDNAELYNTSEIECIDKIKSLMEIIKTQKQYASELRQLRNTRLRLLKFKELSEYTNFLSTHIDEMKDIFTTRMDAKKVKGVIKGKLLLPIELRLIEMKGYETFSLDTNEISLMKSYLRYRWGFSKHLNVFNKNHILNLYTTYNISLFNVADYIRIVLPNKYGINNLIYLDVPKSTTDDPFSFYYLEQISEETRHEEIDDDQSMSKRGEYKNKNWIMDCRLDDLVSDITQTVMEYSVNLYRKIYYAIYHDNVYRKEHGDAQILEYEGAQLIQNIAIMSNYSAFNMKIRNIIKEKCTYVPTKFDKFNLYSDDPINRKRLRAKNNDDIKAHTIKNIGRLFDTIEPEQLEEMYTNVIHKN